MQLKFLHFSLALANDFILRTKGLRNATSPALVLKMRDASYFILRTKGLRNATAEKIGVGASVNWKKFHTQNKGIKECNRSYNELL